FEEVLRKSAELEKIAMAERKAKKSKCPPIGNTEEAEPAAEALEKPGETAKPANAAPKPETRKCPPIGNTEEAEPAAKPAIPPAPAARQAKPPGIFYPPSDADVPVRVGSFPACATSFMDLI
ncbi:MAG: hypothetical protein LBU23_13570, partial [Planctomycetota bacterium]|nr:hypothetical protein [Planctomycetota bacterium]